MITARCKLCREPIEFRRTEHGADMPVNLEPVRVVPLRRTEGSSGALSVVLASGEIVLCRHARAEEKAYVLEEKVSHFSTCKPPEATRSPEEVRRLEGARSDEARARVFFEELDRLPVGKARTSKRHTLLCDLLARARADEREECAKACESLRSGVQWGAGKGVGNLAWDNARGICADKIRARGEA